MHNRLIIAHDLFNINKGDFHQVGGVRVRLNTSTCTCISIFYVCHTRELTDVHASKARSMCCAKEDTEEDTEPYD